MELRRASVSGLLALAQREHEAALQRKQVRREEQRLQHALKAAVKCVAPAAPRETRSDLGAGVAPVAGDGGRVGGARAAQHGEAVGRGHEVMELAVRLVVVADDARVAAVVAAVVAVAGPRVCIVVHGLSRLASAAGPDVEVVVLSGPAGRPRLLRRCGPVGGAQAAIGDGAAAVRRGLRSSSAPVDVIGVT